MIEARNNSNDNFENYDFEGPKRSKNKSKYKKNQSFLKKEERDDRMILSGVVEEALPGTWFHVKINSGDVLVLATLSGKMRQNHIQILPGDKVTIEVSPYDTSRGRIVRRN